MTRPLFRSFKCDIAAANCHERPFITLKKNIDPSFARLVLRTSQPSDPGYGEV